MKIWKKIILVVLIILSAVAYSYGEWPRAIYDTDVSSSVYENSGELTEGTVFEQRFVCSDEGFCGLKVKLTKLDHLKIGVYSWKIQETESGTIAGSGMIDESMTENKIFESASALKRGNIELDIPDQKGSEGKEYLFTIEAKNVEPEETMAVYLTNKSGNDSFLKIGEEDSNQVGVIKLRYHRFNYETFIVFLGIMTYLAVFIKFMYRLFR